MEINNPKYKNQGIHIVSTIFTIDEGILKILLIKRRNEPFKNKWSLVSGALYNDERVEEGLNREINEKTGLNNIYLEFFDIFDNPKRSPLMRMVGIAYIGVVDKLSCKIETSTEKTIDAGWFTLDQIPDLGYDHNEVLEKAIIKLKERINDADLLSLFFPNGFTMPELQMVYENFIGKEVERRNFKKKLLNTNLIIETNNYRKFKGNKPAKIYKFKNIKKSVF